MGIGVAISSVGNRSMSKSFMNTSWSVAGAVPFVSWLSRASISIDTAVWLVEDESEGMGGDVAVELKCCSVDCVLEPGPDASLSARFCTLFPPLM